MDSAALAKALATLLQSVPTNTVNDFLTQIQSMTTVNQSNAVASLNAGSGRTGKLVIRAGKTVAKAQSSVGGKKLRDLNSFMAYRSYYNGMFPKLPQKSKSGLLRILWNNDPFKAKWAILAKAYSTLRDDHGPQICVRSFMSLCGPFIGVIPPADYLATMHWNVNVSGSGDITLQHDSIGNNWFDQALSTTSISAPDVVAYCYEVGYVKLGSNGMTPPTMGPGPSPVLAFATQPALATSTAATTAPTTIIAPQQTVAAPVPNLLPNAPTSAQTDTNGSDNLRHNIELFLHDFKSKDNKNSGVMVETEVEDEKMDELSPHDQLVVENEVIAQEQADFRDLFLPFGDPLLPYDPYTAQSLFEPFNISEYILL